MRTARFVACLLAFSITLSQIGYLPVYGARMLVSSQKKADGIVIVDVKSESDKKLRIGVQSNDGEKVYYFTYSKDDGAVAIPLMFGNGSYNICLYEEADGNIYDLRGEQDIDLQLEDYDTVYLSSSVMVPWSDADATIAKVEELISAKKGDFEKFRAIYRYVTENIKYDITKTVEVGYRSSPDITLSDGSGVCLDIAVLLAAMLRSAGIKCRLVYGHVIDVEGLHSWNEVLIRGKWVVVDPTRDSQCYVSLIPYKYAKLPRNYMKTYTF